MKPTILMSAILFASIILGWTLRPAWSQPQTSAEPGKRRPVLVELFTSEGCSSCPPADALLAQLSTEQPLQNAEIIAIEEHVDYWNQQGWMDPFSSSDWTLRQQEYVSRFKENSPYTPEMVVDGQSRFVGSDAHKAQNAIQEAAQREKVEITLDSAKPFTDGMLHMNIRVGKLGNQNVGSLEIWQAITEDNLSSSVKGGENAGKDLKHAGVLRELRKIGVAKGDGDPAFTGTSQVKLKSSWKRDHLHVVVFLQDKKTWHILGAASQSVAN